MERACTRGLTVDLVLTEGEIISPFSTGNLPSSRSLDTVERYIALNSTFLLPALDAISHTSDRASDEEAP